MNPHWEPKIFDEHDEICIRQPDVHAKVYGMFFMFGFCSWLIVLSERSLFAVARPSVVCLSVVCNARAPYSGSCNFRQSFYGVWYLGHPLTSVENITEIVPGEPHRRGS